VTVLPVAQAMWRYCRAWWRSFTWLLFVNSTASYFQITWFLF
jgi:hypothetical protein